MNLIGNLFSAVAGAFAGHGSAKHPTGHHSGTHRRVTGGHHKAGHHLPHVHQARKAIKSVAKAPTTVAGSNPATRTAPPKTRINVTTKGNVSTGSGTGWKQQPRDKNGMWT